ncbi:RICIN domain-containing protein [Actinoplanes sp. Pm04-4]|uniref:RICIN domain-containing protein n=1 Tax=Paractinoplanes pyxinae TaxID=2997416 RepID=A0ABT4B3B5_9ACTN|nr:RICIN domain-containing protein [Actinoplanes pyxinae]MCY1140976.1 RICIN domain-containing protein [Actinoplanes pyxinae]
MRRSMLAGLVSLACAVALLPAAAAQATAGDGIFRIINAVNWALSADGNYEGVNAAFAGPNPSPGNGGPIASQGWRRSYDSDGLLRFRSTVSGSAWALTVNTGVDWVNKPVILMASNSTFPNQKWRALPASNGFVLLQNPYTGKCLGEPAGGSTFTVYVVACNTGDNLQRWKVTDND